MRAIRSRQLGRAASQSVDMQHCLPAGAASLSNEQMPSLCRCGRAYSALAACAISSAGSVWKQGALRELSLHNCVGLTDDALPFVASVGAAARALHVSDVYFAHRSAHWRACPWLGARS